MDLLIIIDDLINGLDITEYIFELKNIEGGVYDFIRECENNDVDISLLEPYHDLLFNEDKNSLQAKVLGKINDITLFLLNDIMNELQDGEVPMREKFAILKEFYKITLDKQVLSETAESNNKVEIKLVDANKELFDE